MTPVADLGEEMGGLSGHLGDPWETETAFTVGTAVLLTADPLQRSMHVYLKPERVPGELVAVLT